MTVNNKSSRVIGLLCILGVLICWTSAPLFIKTLTAYTDAWTQNFVRYATAAVFWLPLLIYNAARKKIPPKMWLIAAIPSFFNAALQSCWGNSMYFLDPGFATLIQRSTIFWVIIMTVIMFPDQRGFIRRPGLWVGIFMVIIGVFGILYYQEGFGDKVKPEGVIIVMGNAVFWSAYTVTIKKYMQNINPVVGFAIISLYTSFLLGILAFTVGDPSQYAHFTSKVWFLLIISGFICMAIAHVLYVAAVQLIGTTLPVIILSLVPVCVLFASWVIHHEVLNFWQYISGAVVIAGSVTAVIVQGRYTESQKQIEQE